LRARVWKRESGSSTQPFVSSPDEKTARQRVVLFETPKTPRKTCRKSPLRDEKKDRVEKTKTPKEKKETDLENNNRKSRLAGEKAGRKSRGTLQARALRRASTRKENPFFAQAKNEKCERTRFFSPLAPSESEEVREVVRIAKEKKRFFALCV
jgi:hypothetical protein